MRVLYVENSYGEMGGSLMSMLQAARELVEQNAILPPEKRFEPSFYFLFPNLLIEEFRSLGPVIIERESENNDYADLGWPIGLPRALWATVKRLPAVMQKSLGEILPLSLKVARHARRLGVDLVHTNCRLGSNEYAILGARLAGVPVVAHERLIYPISRLTKRFAAAADGVIAISKIVGEHLTSQRVPMRRLDLVYNGISTSDLSRFANRPRTSGTPTRVGMVGRITRWKGQHVFIDAVLSLAREHPDIEFHLAGAPPPREEAYGQALIDTIEDAGLEKKVFFHGTVKDIYKFIAGMDIITHCSVEPEPLGRVILEAMALRKPVIATRGGAAEEICTHEQDALLIDPNRPDMLASSILRLIREPATAAALAANAAKTIEDRFSIERQAQKLREIYEEVLDNSARRPIFEALGEFLADNPFSRSRQRSQTPDYRS